MSIISAYTNLKGEKMFFRELETKDILLKNIGHDDAEFVLKQFSTDEVNTYLFDMEPMASVEEAEEMIDFYCEKEPRSWHRWILVLKENGQKIGTCGFHNWKRETSETDIGYDLQPEYWRKGYMSLCMVSILKFAKEEMKVSHVYAHIAVGNTASEKLAEKSGFIKTGKTYYEVFRGQKYLHNIYALDFKEGMK
ncbi:MAG: GNAT family N-acetyltransferase [Clostridia bacterium]